MSRPALAVLMVGIAATVAMLLYPPWMMGLTGSHLGYYFAFQQPAMVEAFGRLDVGLLVMQLAILWAVTGGILIALRGRDDR